VPLGSAVPPANPEPSENTRLACSPTVRIPTLGVLPALVGALSRWLQAHYVALLSAAALHGAAHQQPQEFQVMADEPLRQAVAGSSRLRFFFKKHVTRTPVVPVKTETGSMSVSTPEATALDLLRYLHGAGGLGNVATVLSELVERLDPAGLVAVAKIEADVAAAQRLGFLLERVGAGDRTEPLARWVAERRPRAIRLRADQEAKSAPKNARWQVLVNAPLEVAG